jgi:hypothetical protein
MWDSLYFLNTLYYQFEFCWKWQWKSGVIGACYPLVRHWVLFCGFMIAWVFVSVFAVAFLLLSDILRRERLQSVVVDRGMAVREGCVSVCG